MSLSRLGTSTAILLALSARPCAAQDDAQPHRTSPAERLGAVEFRTSCAAAVIPQFNRAAALAHSFEFASAINGFAAVLAAGSSCAMAERGVALSRWVQRIAVRLADTHETYWSQQVEIQRRGAAAWLALAQGRQPDAMALMQSAVELEDGTEKSAVTPGPLAPARQLLGDMLLQSNDPAAALKEFEAVLRKEPNRFRSMYGAAKSAALAGDRTKARAYCRELVAMCGHGEPDRPQLAEARQFLAPCDQHRPSCFTPVRSSIDWRHRIRWRGQRRRRTQDGIGS